MGSHQQEPGQQGSGRSAPDALRGTQSVRAAVGCKHVLRGELEKDGPNSLARVFQKELSRAALRRRQQRLEPQWSNS